MEFIEFVNDIITSKINTISTIEQLDRASSSIHLNITEGTGKYTGTDKCRYYDIAWGSALEFSACSDILLKNISDKVVENGKKFLVIIVSMLIGLIKSSSERVYEDEFKYRLSEND